MYSLEEVGTRYKKSSEKYWIMRVPMLRVKKMKVGGGVEDK